jgi:hypothetical protein
MSPNLIIPSIIGDRQPSTLFQKQIHSTGNSSSDVLEPSSQCAPRVLHCSATRTLRANTLEYSLRYATTYTASICNGSRFNSRTIAPLRASIHHRTCCRTHSSLIVHPTCHLLAVAPLPLSVSPAPSPIALPIAALFQYPHRPCFFDSV